MNDSEKNEPALAKTPEKSETRSGGLGLAAVIAALLGAGIGYLLMSAIFGPIHKEWANLSPIARAFSIGVPVLVAAMLLVAVGVAGRRFQVAANVVLQIAVVVAIFVGVNWIAFRRPPQRWDMSRDKKFELSPMTVNLLKTLEKPVKVIIFAGQTPIYGDLLELVRSYEFASGKKISKEEIDPFGSPARAKEAVNQYKLTENSIAVVVGEKSKVVDLNEMAEFGQQMNPFQPPEVKSFKGEQVLTSTILELTEGKSSKLYFTSGHQEVAPSGPTTKLLKAYIDRLNLKQEAVNLSNVDAVPADASAVVIFGAKFDFSEREIALLNDYWGKNGRVFVMLNPDGKTERLNAWVGTQGVTVKNDWVLRTAKQPGIDPATGNYGTVNVIVGSAYGDFPPTGTPLSKDLEGAQMVFLGHTTSLEIDNAKTQAGGIKAFPLVNADASLWAESEFNGEARTLPTFDAAKDRKAPFPVAVAVEKGASADPKVKVPTSRMVVVGNADFLTDQGSRQTEAGIFLASNVFNWMADRDQMVGIPPKEKKAQMLTMDDKKFAKIFLTIMLVIPAGVGLVGAGVWLARRG